MADSTSPPALDHRATITQRVAAQLGAQICAGAYTPGAPLRESDLATHFDVSRHVVREALRILAGDGLVDYASFRGARVPVLSAADARDIYRVRRMVECGADAMSVLPDSAAIMGIHRAFSAAVKAGDFSRVFDLDIAFHKVIIAASGSERATIWLVSLMQSLRLAHLVAPSFNKQALAASVPQHGAIVDAIQAGDPARARAAMKAHLDESERVLIQDMSRQRA